MAYHLIRFVAGAVVGGLAVYLVRDDRLRKDLRQSAGNLSRKAQQAAGEVAKGLAVEPTKPRTPKTSERRANPLWWHPHGEDYGLAHQTALVPEQVGSGEDQERGAETYVGLFSAQVPVRE